MSDIKKNLGRNIKYYRNLRKLTQEELAERLDMNARSLSFIECGTNFITAQTLEKLCNILNVTPKQLFDFNYSQKSSGEIEKEIGTLIKHHPEKLNDIYNILKGFLG